MPSGPIVVLAGVSKRFKLFRHRPSSLKHALVTSERASYEEFWALREITLEISRGETIGIVGRNGSGKSTLLRVIAKIYRPTEGTVSVRGRIAPLLEVGAGFHPELTGRENIFLNGSLLGLSRRDVSLRFDEIVGFSELERFVDTPVKFYSSGMYMRLGFAVAVNVRPDILLVDEVLAVGDAEFQRRCLERVEELTGEGTTIILVSHQLRLIESTCGRCVWLEEGRMKEEGATDHVLRLYQQDVAV